MSFRHTTKATNAAFNFTVIQIGKWVQNHLLWPCWSNLTSPSLLRLLMARTTTVSLFCPSAAPLHSGPPARHHTTSKEAHLQGQPEHPPLLTSTIWQEARSSRGGLEAREISKWKEVVARKKRGFEQHDWVLREMLSSQEWFGTAHQSASSSNQLLLDASCWLAVQQDKYFKTLTKAQWGKTHLAGFRIIPVWVQQVDQVVTFWRLMTQI